MNQKQFAYVNAIYDIEDNLEEVKNYFRNNGYFNEYKMAVEIQTIFRRNFGTYECIRKACFKLKKAIPAPKLKNFAHL